jgi:hypothetical protein
MTENMTKRARLRVMHRPGSTVSHVLREDSDRAICGRVQVGRWQTTEDATATCNACVEAVTARELGLLIRMEKHAGRPPVREQELQEVATVLQLAGIAEQPKLW